MAEDVPASPSGGAGTRGLHSGIIQWLVDNFCICEGYSVPRCLMYEIYVESCGPNAQDQVNPATFGKLVRLVFPDLGTRRLGTRGSARYHYDGICIKKSSFFYAQYCYLLGEKSYHSGDIIGFEKSTNYNSIIQQEGIVEDLLTSFWKSLQQDTVMLMTLPDVCQLFKCYDVQLYKGIEDVLLHDFLEDVSIQYLKSVRLFSKKFKLWLLNALEGFPALVQISKLKEVTVFVKRLRRKTYLSNMAKTMRMVLKNNRRVSVLKSDLHAIISRGTLDMSKKALPSNPSSAADLETHAEMKCLSSLISLLGTSTDLSIFLNCLSSNLQTFVFQPSRSKEEFIKLAASFQLRWNFLLTAVSKAMTLCHRDSFGSWHLFHLLLLEFVTHLLQSCMEEGEEDDDGGHLKEMLPDDRSLVQPDQASFHPPHSSPAQEYESPSVDPHWVTLKHRGQSQCPMGVSGVVLSVLGFLVDSDTGNKLIQVLLEDKATESTVKLSLPVGQEALVTLKDGQKFVIHISDVPQSSENIFFQGKQCNI
ncbi:DNA-binding protein RFX8 isoform X3 [Zalophus californianus]|uniref:DNA-binding protein RFX8 n=1 Tax=Zalophus californianus TaxID=9704 RepID=A0A6J2FAR1_ZALCA|nr:DNA-binding protein RFX8 isoform X3 [Zalophus californianus]